MINRAAIILRYREPAVFWINESDPFDEAPGFDLESVNQERTVYLISDADAGRLARGRMPHGTRGHRRRRAGGR